jgi:ubiquinone/menaquinone biosynthesis C-methylase UbiE
VTELYSRYYDEHNEHRNDLLANPEVAFQILAIDRANIRALQRIRIDRKTARVLDVGCGTGPGLLTLLRWGFVQRNLSGVDISQERIDEARAALPLADLRCESGDALSYADSSFDLVTESTMFILMPDEATATGIAREMIRVTKPGGHIMVIDWRYSKPGTPSRIASLFDVGGATTIAAREKGALVPPLGRRLSRYAPSLYFVVQALLPPLVGQMTTVLRKS